MQRVSVAASDPLVVEYVQVVIYVGVVEPHPAFLLVKAIIEMFNKKNLSVFRSKSD